jgi:hypothetical protein
MIQKADSLHLPYMTDKMYILEIFTVPSMPILSKSQSIFQVLAKAVTGAEWLTQTCHPQETLWKEATVASIIHIECKEIHPLF